MDTQRKAAEAFAGALRNRLGDNLVEVRLFGSYARGCARVDSDIDLFVLVRERSPAVEESVSDTAFEANLAFDVFISPTVYAEREYDDPVIGDSPFVASVRREGVAL